MRQVNILWLLLRSSQTRWHALWLLVLITIELDSSLRIPQTSILVRIAFLAATRTLV